MDLLEQGTDSEDELPEGWEERVTAEGRVYYANHLNCSTQWQHPITNKEKVVSGELPYGWEKMIEDDTIVYVNHLNKKTSYTDPRLAFSKPIGSKSLPSWKRFTPDSTALDVIKERDLTGQYAIVTGSNRGLGLEIAKALSFTGCYVILACRDVDAGLLAYENLKKERESIKLEIMELNLASLQSVKSFSDKIYSRNIAINLLILNAATFELDYKCSQDNLEMMYQVNYLSQFYLTRLLMANLREAKDARIIAIGCESYRGANLSKNDIGKSKCNVSKSEFHFMQQYCNSKMCLILFAYEMNRRINKLQVENLICKSCHPGNMLPTKFFQKWSVIFCLNILAKYFSKKIENAAATPIYLATEKIEYINKRCHYYINFCENMSAQQIQDSVLAYRLWEISESILIDRTQDFDTLLANGDSFSSLTKVVSVIEQDSLLTENTVLNENPVLTEITD